MLARAIGAFALCAIATSCARPPTRLVTTEQPRQTLISYPNGVGAETTTIVSSLPSAQAAGVDGRSVAISLSRPKRDEDRERRMNALVTVDIAGDVGILGSLHARGSIASVSTRAAKRDIAPFVADPLALVDRVAIVSYRYRGESATASRHIGFVAEDAPAELSGPKHDRFDLGNSAAVDAAALLALRRRVATLERGVARLKRLLADDSSSRSGVDASSDNGNLPMKFLVIPNTMR